MADWGLVRGLVAIGLTLGASGPAFAQDDPDDVPIGTPDEPGTPPPLAPAPPVSHRDGFIWVRRGPPTSATAMSDVTHFEGGVDLVAATTLDGAVWLWVETPGRSRWERVLDAVPVGLGAASNDEDLLRAFDAALGDLQTVTDDDLESIFVDDPTAVADDVVAESVAAAEESAAQVRAELTANPDYFATSDSLGLLQAAVLRGDRDAARPRAWFAPDGRLFVGRVDGLWLSEDLGDTWRHVLDVPVTALALLPSRGLWVAGTGDGVRFSTDGIAWIDVADGTEGLHVYDLAAAPEGMYAATGDGLWFAPDAQDWGPVGSVRDAALAVRTDPDWFGGVWFSTDETVLRSDDGGLTARATTEAPLPGVVEILRLGPGRLLAVGSDGPWETIDGATTWVPLSRGLSDPDTRGIDVAGDRVFVAGDEGLFELMQELLMGEDAGVQQPMEWIPVETLVAAALHRPGLSDRVDAHGLRLSSTFLPAMTLEGYAQPAKSRQFSVSGGTVYDTTGQVFDNQSQFDDFIEQLDADQLQFVRGGTTDGRDMDWGLVLRFEWTPEGRKSADSPEAIVVDGQLEIDDGGDRSVLTSKVSRGATAYRQKLVSDITSHYYGRQELVAKRPSMLADTLIDRVELEIHIQELEAYLDALTDGAVSRYDDGTEQE